MKQPLWNPLSLDVLSFAQNQAALSGQWRLSELPRLSESSLADELSSMSNPSSVGLVHWHIQGEMNDECAPTKPTTSVGHVRSPSSLLAQATEAAAARVPKAPQVLSSIHVSAQTQILLQCQCCLTPVSLFVEAQRRFIFVKAESEAEILDQEVPEDCDVLVLTNTLNAQELIEDELLLALPLVPRHEQCPKPLKMPPVDIEAEPEPHPFAVLAQLKREKAS
jgi:uncharacterized protein